MSAVYEPSGDRLLILSCSRRKRLDKDLLPAVERYDGPAFRVLRRFLREMPFEAPDVPILSAEYGLIPHDLPIALSPQEREILLKLFMSGLRAIWVRGPRRKPHRGFCNRATHNLWVLLEEARWIRDHLESETYKERYKDRLNNSTYSRLIDRVVEAQ